MRLDAPGWSRKTRERRALACAQSAVTLAAGMSGSRAFQKRSPPVESAAASDASLRDEGKQRLRQWPPARPMRRRSQGSA